MVEVFLEYSQDKIPHADVGRLGGVSATNVSVVTCRESQSKENWVTCAWATCNVAVSAAVFGSSSCKTNQARSENRRIEVSAEHDCHAVDLRVSPHAMRLWCARAS